MKWLGFFSTCVFPIIVLILRFFGDSTLYYILGSIYAAYYLTTIITSCVAYKQLIKTYCLFILLFIAAGCLILFEISLDGALFGLLLTGVFNMFSSVKGFQTFKIKNPIESITKNGTLGVTLGASYEYTMLQMSSLHIPIQEETDADKLCAGLLHKRRIKVEHNLFNTIESLVFEFKDDVLTCISFHFDYSEKGLDATYNMLSNDLSIILKIEPSTVSNGLITWNFGDHYISLIKTPNEYLEKEAEGLSLYIAYK